MSDTFMPIDLRHITTGQSDAGTRRTNSSSESVTAKEGQASAKSVAQQDSVELSGKALLVQSLLNEIAASPEVNNSRVEQLRSSIASGEFSVSADKIASKLLLLDDGLRKLG